jgi:putative Mn2+ efflux pump MntP
MIYPGFTLFGVGLGFLFSGLMNNWNYGMPAGVLIGIGLAMVVSHFHTCKKNH